MLVARLHWHLIEKKKKEQEFLLSVTISSDMQCHRYGKFNVEVETPNVGPKSP